MITERRITIRDLNKTAARLKRMIRKEQFRAKKVKALKEYVDTLSKQLQGYREDSEANRW